MVARHSPASKPARLALVVSHPVQYYVPLYQRLARRTDVVIKVFFTWHAAASAVTDHGFRRQIAWDIPVTEGFDFELVPNTSSDPGTHHFRGLRNPSLLQRIEQWKPDAVHVTGWAWESHLAILRLLHRRGVPTLFRGDSHLLDRSRAKSRWWLKRAFLSRVYSWPAGFLVVGSANREYYRALGVGDEKLHLCPHSIDVARFHGSSEHHERQAAAWRRELDLSDDETVLLFAGKFERKKRPVELMRLVESLPQCITLVMVGGGELEADVKAIAAANPARFRVLPFQNQSRMPAVYRLGDIFVLPSAFGETWGLAVNEALACGRPVIVSDRVGCASDIVDSSCGRVFPADDFSALARAIDDLRTSARSTAIASAAQQRSWMFDVSRTESTLMDCVQGLVG